MVLQLVAGAFRWSASSQEPSVHLVGTPYTVIYCFPHGYYPIASERPMTGFSVHR